MITMGEYSHLTKLWDAKSHASAGRDTPESDAVLNISSFFGQAILAQVVTWELWD